MKNENVENKKCWKVSSKTIELFNSLKTINKFKEARLFDNSRIAIVFDRQYLYPWEIDNIDSELRKMHRRRTRIDLGTELLVYCDVVGVVDEVD